MKNIFKAIVIVLIVGLVSCRNQETEFPDFRYTAGYFPYQYPVRTLVLGDYIFDNTNDNNHKFLISAAMGGVYSNKKDREFTIEVASDLAANALFESTKDTIRLMPQEYYSLSSSNKLVIPAGEVNGNIEVQLKDAFFDDTLAIRLGYVIPVRIVGTSDLDSILSGKPAVSNPDRRIVSHWAVQPKDFTMFAVKYINPYHGKYLHRGASTVRNSLNEVIETTTYTTPYIVNNEIWSLSTTAKNKVYVEGIVRSEIITGTLKMELTFSENGDCTVASVPDSEFVINGTGKFVKEGDEWGDKKRDAIHLTYQFSSDGNTYAATDTLVIRDRAVTLEGYKPVVY